jgi:hypothetical protein
VCAAAADHGGDNIGKHAGVFWARGQHRGEGVKGEWGDGDGAAFQLRGGGWVEGRGLHSFTSQLNLSAVFGIGGARRDCVTRVKGVLGGVDGLGVFVCQTRLKLS